MKKTVVAIILAAVLLTTAWSCDEKGLGDAPVDGRQGDDRPAVVINMPDTFMNVAIKCFSGTAIIAHTREAAPLVIPDSTFCDGNKVVNIPDENGRSESSED